MMTAYHWFLLNFLPSQILQHLSQNNFGALLSGTETAASQITSPASKHMAHYLPRGIQTLEFPCLSRQATRSEVYRTERGTLSPSKQFNAVVVPASASYTCSCTLPDTPGFASYPWLQSQTVGWTTQISNVQRWFLIQILDTKSSISDTWEVQISDYLTLLVLGRDRCSSSEHATSYKLPFSLQSPRDKVKAGTEAALSELQPCSCSVTSYFL